MNVIYSCFLLIGLIGWFALDFIWLLINTIIMAVAFIVCLPGALITDDVSAFKGILGLYGLIISYPNKIVLKTNIHDDTIKEAKEMLFGQEEEES